MSDQLTIHAALALVMRDVKAVGKDGVNKSQGFNFRGIDGVLNVVGPALRTHGVIVLPTVEDVTYNTVEVGQKRTLMREVTMRVRYQFVGPDGGTLDAVVVAESMDSGDKATAKAMSVAFRSALLQVLAIPTHDPDPDEQSYERAGPDPERTAFLAAKAEVVQACKGDKALARKVWGDRSTAPSPDELEAMLTEAAQMGES